MKSNQLKQLNEDAKDKLLKYQKSPIYSLIKGLSTIDTKKLREKFKDNEAHSINSLAEISLPDLIFANEKNAWDPPVVKA